MNVYDFKVLETNNKETSLVTFEGKVLLIVNTATGSGFTPQYEGLEILYEKYKDKGFEILDFPCDQFGKLARGTEEEIMKFCKTRYNVSVRQSRSERQKRKPAFRFLKIREKGTFQ